MMDYELMHIARHYGEEKQTCKLIEELGEAVSAASEVLMMMTYREDAGKGVDLTDRLERLARELADVQVVSEQLIWLFGLQEDVEIARQAGIDKTLRRIAKETACNTN